MRQFRRAKRRVVVTGRSAVYHVMSRIAQRQFWLDDEGKDVFLRMAYKQAAFAGVEVLAYCILNNHFHLLIRVPEGPIKEAGKHLLSDEILLQRYRDYYGEQMPLSTYSYEELKLILEGPDTDLAEKARCRILARMGNLSVFMRELKQRFTIWYNNQGGTDGTIWSARFKSVIVEDRPEITSRVAAYIDLNPVRARLVADPAAYRWCSYAAAMAGVTRARDGLCGLFYVKDGEQTDEFRGVMKAYRLILYGKGDRLKAGASRDGKDGGMIDREAVRRVLEAGGEVPIEEALRCRIRYFSDGGALGDESFIEGLLGEDATRRKRKRRATVLKPGFWGGMGVLRNLQRRIFGTD